MIPDSAELRRLLDFAVALARQAGEITNRYFKGSFAAERKADNSFVTVADREAEKYLRTQIERAFPEDAILGEEEGEKLGRSNRRWILDPIDGTYSFVRGVPLYGVLIGLELDSEAVLGVVNLPALNELVCAARGIGCFWNDAPARVSSTASLDDALLLATDFGDCEKYGFGPRASHMGRCLRARAGSHWPRRHHARSDHERMGLCPTSAHRGGSWWYLYRLAGAENDRWRQCHLDQRNIV